MTCTKDWSKQLSGQAMYFKSPLMVILWTLPGVLLSLAVSLLIHPLIYHNHSSRFARLRGGPAIGIAVIVANAIPKRAIIRAEIESGEPSESLGDLLAMLWSCVEVASGVFVADLLRSHWRKSE